MNAGERSAWVFGALEAHERELVAYARRLAGDAERARDAVQETFLELCTQEPARLDGRLRAWLFRVCRNKAIDGLRKEGRMHADDGTAGLRVADRAPEPAEALERSETLAGVLASIDALPRAQQEVLVLKFRHGMAYREISEVTGHSVANVGTLLHVALRALRALHGGDRVEGCTT